MNDATIEAILPELRTALTGQRIGRIFLLTRTHFAIDLRLPGSVYLFISVDPASPRIHLIKRRLKDVERASIPPSPFVNYLRKQISGSLVRSIDKFPNERLLTFSLAATSEIGERQELTLAVQLTGRSANLLLLDGNGLILAAARETRGDGQEAGTIYSPPVRPGAARFDPGEVFDRNGFDTLSESLDHFYTRTEAERRFRSRADAARKKLTTEISKRRKLVGKLNKDLEGHGDAERWKRFGDLLLANLSTAKHRGDAIVVTDFFDESLPEVEIPGDNDSGLTELAEKYFRRYTKARNAAAEIAERLTAVEAEIEDLEREKERLEEAIETKDETFFPPEENKRGKERSGRKKQLTLKGVRRFKSSDGLEILVGKKAPDNDNLTFRVARSLDLWLHAADYPGSHVVVRRQNRDEVPQNTLLEAAELAAFYSSAREQGKVAVHYTQKKFVNKPKGAAPGLVSLSSFKTVMVQAKFPDGVTGEE